jgi:RNA-directed DNA polymerase
MQKIDNIYEKIIHKENLYKAVYAASRGKRCHADVAWFNLHMEKNIAGLHRDMRSDLYRPGGYTVFKVYDPKEREIARAPFRDRVVHHAVHDVIEPLIDPAFIFDSWACRRGKGTHAAGARARSFLKANKFCLHGDVRKFFFSIDRGILKYLLRRRIADRKVIRLFDMIINSSPLANGLPIGNLTSQFFANLYLHELDYFVKNILRIRYYMRYMDDFLLFGNEMERLKAARGEIRQFLAGKLRLVLHPDKSQIFNTAEGLTFLGFRIFADTIRIAGASMQRALDASGAWLCKTGVTSSQPGRVSAVEHGTIQHQTRGWQTGTTQQTRIPDGTTITARVVRRLLLRF